tara:strand:+ start:692 stop:1456 length:765 start_codon:yes stop_codon:yes gene_type:complete
MSKKIFTTVLVIFAFIAMISLGFWQLDRHSQKSEINEKISMRLDNEPLSLVDIAKLKSYEIIVMEREFEYRSIAVSGKYIQEDSVLVRNRTYNGVPGFWLLTPFQLSNNQIIVVNRGWVPIAAENYIDLNTSIFNLTGILRNTELAKGLQRADAREGVLESLARPDLARYEDQLGYEIFPMYIQLTGQNPQQTDGFPKILDLPKFSEGQHLSYAVQWFIFASIAAVGYPLVLWSYSKTKDKKKRRESDIPVDYL